MKKQYLMLIISVLSFSQGNAAIIKCLDSSGRLWYKDSNTEDGLREIREMINNGLTCENFDKRSPEQKLKDEKKLKAQIQLETKLAKERYYENVRATARFLDDVDAARKRK